MTGLRRLMLVPSFRAYHTFQLWVWVEAACIASNPQLKPSRSCSSQQHAAYLASIQQHASEPGGLRTTRNGYQDKPQMLLEGEHRGRGPQAAISAFRLLQNEPSE
jgi:hypothetical protein